MNDLKPGGRRLSDFKREARRSARNLALRAGLDVHPRSKSVDGRRVGLLNLAKPDVVLDVGANAGQYATELRRAGFTGKIVSFEPGVGAYTKLAKAAAADPKWSAEKLALGKEEGSVELQVTARSVFSTTKAATDAMLSATTNTSVVSTETVPAKTLDAWLAESPYANSRLALKIDVQGAEQDVLAGATDALKQVEFLEVELPLVEVYAGQWTLTEALDQLIGAGFRPVLTENLMMSEDRASSLQVNFLFLRSDS